MIIEKMHPSSAIEVSNKNEHSIINDRNKCNNNKLVALEDASTMHSELSILIDKSKYENGSSTMIASIIDGIDEISKYVTIALVEQSK